MEKFPRFSFNSKNLSITQSRCNVNQLRYYFEKLLTEIPLNQAIKSILSNILRQISFTDDEIYQISIFDNLDEDEKKQSINNLLSNLQNTFGKTVIKQGIEEKNSDYFKYDKSYKIKNRNG